MITAVGIAVVDGVAAFRGFAVAFELFVSDGIETQGDGIGFQQPALCVVSIHFAVGFADDEFGDFTVGRQGGLSQQILLPRTQSCGIAYAEAFGRAAFVFKKDICAAD